MPRQRLIFSDTDPQSTHDNPHQSGAYDSDSDLDSPSYSKTGLTKSYSSSEESSDSRLPTNRTGDSEAAAEESFAGGVGKTERTKEPSRRVEDSLTQYQVQIGPNYSYQVQVDGNGRLRRLSEIDEDGRERCLSLRSLACNKAAIPDSPFSETDEDESTMPRESRGGRTSAHGQRNDGGCASLPPQGYTTRNEQDRQDEYEPEEKQEDEKDSVGRGKHSYPGFWTELSADME
ncbi:hypothetical protein BDR22DRAFT_966247 [Usnea florida]